MGFDITSFKKKYVIGPEDVPQDAPVPVLIEGFDSEEATNQKKEKYMRHSVWFKGWSLPLRLNNKQIDSLVAACGTKDTDGIVGSVVLIQTVPDTDYGETKLKVQVLGIRAKLGVKPIGMAESVNVAMGRQIEPTPPTKQLATKDMRPIGKEIAAKMVAQLKLKSKTFENMMYWLKMNDREGHDLAVNMELETIPACFLHSVKFYLESLKTPPELVGGPPKHDPESDTPPPADIPIDVPF